MRKASLETIKRLTEADLEKTGIHSEMGRYTLENWFKSYITHPGSHAEQITKAFVNKNYFFVESKKR